MPSNDDHQFGPFRLKVDVGLWRDDSEVALPPKEMALLKLLVLNKNRVVEHETIFRDLWPRQEVSYQSLIRCVYSLRNALQPEGREYIKTVPKRGYKLAVPAEGPWFSPNRPALESSIKTNTKSFAHFQEGLACANNPTPDAMERALHWFRESVRLDPSYAAGHAAIAEVSMYQCYRGFIQPQEGLRVGLNACHAALTIDPDTVQALGLRGWFEALQQGEMEAGKKSVARAQHLDPEYSRSYAYEALIHRAEGNLLAAMASANRAVELDPHSLFNAQVYAFTLFLAGKVNEALDFERQILDRRPDDDLAHGYISIFLATLEDYPEALKFAHKALALAPDIPATWAFLAWPLAVCGKTEDATRLLEKALSAQLPRCPRPIMAPALVALGRAEEALSLLNEARVEQCPWFYGARVDPRLTALRDDRRWNSLYR
jgi:DNA-binding winged helix-turn-helix (wHTH) protein/Flp pilus assembly protein TadD